ncbi:Mur ligase family protein [Novipirellula aureliae]|nr:Mur ligase family protein [Novipirellula aureliae]
MRHTVNASSARFSTSSLSSAPESGDRSNESANKGAPPQPTFRSLRSLLAHARFFSGDDVSFHSIAESAASAEPGQLVVYRIGEICPSQLIADALARGAAGILTEQILPCPIPQCIVGDVDLTLADLQSRLLDRPDRKLLTVGVYGSAGKTTTSLLVAQLLRSIGLRTSYQTDLGSSDGIVQTTSPERVPAAGALVEWLGESYDAGAKTAVIELSDDAAKHGRYDCIEFDLLIVTGSTVTENDFGPSGLTCVLERVASQGVVIASADQPGVLRTIKNHGSNVMTYGVRSDADVTAKVIDQEGGMSTLMMTHETLSVVMETPLCGAAMALNHAAAAVVGILLNQPLSEVVEHLGGLRSVPGRMQTLSAFGQADVIVDAARTPEQISSTLRAARLMKQPGGRLWCVMAIDPGAAPAHLALIGSHAERFSDRPILSCVMEAKESFLQASHAVLDGVKKCAMMRLVADHRRAVEWAMQEASPNDTIICIGGIGNASADAQRSKIEQITNWIESSRSSTQEEAEPKILSMFAK